MGQDRTITPLPQPRFGIEEVVYIRVSAIKGYLEPLTVNGVEYIIADNEYRYSFVGNFPRISSPICLLGSELITLCEALDLQIACLTREHQEIATQLAANCPSGSSPVSVYDVDPTQPKQAGSVLIPPQPRFAINEVVYLTETASSTGRLEAFRINGDPYFDVKLNQWVYRVLIYKQFGGTMTIGDRDDMRRSMTIEFAESAFCTLCDALYLAEQFLQLALARATLRKQNYCM